MKCKVIVFMALLIPAFFTGISAVYAWTGDTWGTESRETILRNASEMTNFTWTPNSKIENGTSPETPSLTYSPGTIYDGETYCYFNNPVDNWDEFYSKVNSVSCQTPPCLTKYGNECSGYVSIAWELPKRYNTSAFECDAAGSTLTTCSNKYNPATDNYVTSLGLAGSGKNVGLLRGDAFVKKGSHIVIFESYWYDFDGAKKGINVYEQATYPKWRALLHNKYWTWSLLSSYRPIRRNKIDETYKFIKQWGSAGTGDYQFDWPSEITVDSAGSVYVADSGNDRIQKFTGDGIFQKSIKGTVDHPIDWPTGVAVDSSGYLYIVGDSHVLKFTGNGSYFSEWGDYGTSNGNFIMPSDIALDPSGNVYVTDISPDTSRVQKFTKTGTFLTKWGSYGSTDGLFDYPYGISVDKGNVYVADTGNDRIQKFDSNGVFKWTNYGAGDHQMSFPADVAADALGYIYVADSGNDRILKFDSAGNYIMKWGSYGTSAGQFDWPGTLAVDSNWNVYVLDQAILAPRIQKFTPVSPQPVGPTSLTAITASATQINLAWNDNSDNETGFVITRKNGIRGTYAIIADTVPANSTSYNDTTVSGTDYYYAVYAYNSFGYSAYSNEASTPPSAPESLNATSISASQITLSWTDNSDNETGFQIYRKINSASFALLHTTGAGAVSYNDTSATGNDTTNSYSYYIKACNLEGCSPPTTKAIVPFKPINFTTAAVSSTQIDMSWTDKSNNETGFQVYRKDGNCASTSTWTLINTTVANATTISDIGLTSGRTYSYKIRSYRKSSSAPYAYGYSRYTGCSNKTTP
jgi:hypothetical protein